MTLIVLNTVVWLAIHLLVSVICTRIPTHTLLKLKLLPFQVQLENNLYTFLRVKEWKARLPDAGALFRKGRKMNSFSLRSTVDREHFYIETKRAELAHLLQILPAPFFFLFNPPEIASFMIVYALLFNLPFIMTQRLNRLRLERLMST